MPVRMTYEPPQDRDRAHLQPLFRKLSDPWLKAADAWIKRKFGPSARVFTTETFRTPQRQQWLFDAGRKRPPWGRFLTYTLDSAHRYGLAEDYAISIAGKLRYDLFDELYAAVPPEQYGLERLDFELVHLQPTGMNRVGVVEFARRNNVKRDVRPNSK